MTRKFYQNGRNWSVLLKIQQTSTVFAKLDMTQHKNVSQATSGFFETIREVPFKTVENL